MSRFKIVMLPGLAVAAALAGCSAGSSGPAGYPTQASEAAYRPYNNEYIPNYRASTSIGSVMTTPDGATIYTFDRDQLGQTTCYADCASQWPPVLAAAGAQPYGRMSLVDRDGGQRQWAYDGKPLYTFAGDQKHGDVKGDNAGAVWHVVH